MPTPRIYDYAEVHRLSSQGLSYTQIAERMGAHPKSIWKIVNGARPERRAIPMHDPKPAPPRHTYATVEAMVAEGIPRREAMRQFHRSRA
jgi:hypothetical protein